MKLIKGLFHPQIKNRKCLYFNRGILYVDIGIFPKTDNLHVWFEVRIFGFGVNINYTKYIPKHLSKRLRFGSFMDSWIYYRTKRRLLKKFRQYKSLLINEKVR